MSARPRLPTSRDDDQLLPVPLPVPLLPLPLLLLLDRRPFLGVSTDANAVKESRTSSMMCVTTMPLELFLDAVVRTF
jgi:hypothetical protein